MHTLKHRIVESYIRENIRLEAYGAGEKIPSENELSDALRVSRQTVRQAIGTLEREGLLYRVRGSGTFVKPARAAAEQSTRRVGVVITYLNDYVFPAIVEGIEQVLAENGYTMTLGITGNRLENERKALLQMLDSGVDGLIIEGTKSALPNPNASVYGMLRQKNLPFLFINGYYENIGSGYVILDDLEAGATLCGELIRAGHTRIGGLFKSDDMQGPKRYEGFAAEMERHGLPVRDESVVWYTTEDIPYLSGGSMDSALLARFSGVTGVVCYNDLIAVKLIEALRRNGRAVPGECSVASVDDSALAAPGLYDLTTFRYPAREIGEQAAAGLLKILSGRERRVQIRLRGDLIRRSSSPPPKDTPAG